MADAKGIKLAFAALGKSRHAAVHAQSGHAFAAAGQYLVRVSLVADIPDQAIFRRVEDVMQRDCQLDSAEIRRQMPAGARDRVDKKIAQLFRQLRQLLAIQCAQLRGVLDGVEQWIGGHGIDVGLKVSRQSIRR